MLGQRPPGGRCGGAWLGSVVSEKVCRVENKAGMGNKADLGEPDLGPNNDKIKAVFARRIGPWLYVGQMGAEATRQ